MHEGHELLNAGRGEVEPDGLRRREEAEDHDIDEAEGARGEIARRDRQASGQPQPPAVEARPVRQMPPQARQQESRLDGGGEACRGERAGDGDPGLGRRTRQHGTDHRHHDQGLTQKVGRRDGQKRPALTAGHTLEIVLEGEERHDEGRDENGRAVGAGEQAALQEGDGEAAEREGEPAAEAGQRPAEEEAAHAVEPSRRLIGGQEPAGPL